MRKIRQIAVIGSGIMGGGIAALFAGAGVKTLLMDILSPDLKESEKNDLKMRNRIAEGGLQSALKSKPPVFMTPKDAERITIGNLEDDFHKLSSCDWIIEAVVENLKIKRELFKKIDSVKKAGAILSSNTSGIPLHAMSEGLSREFREHFLGTHFFNPVRYMKLLEIIPGKETLPEILDFVAHYGERVLGKGVVWAKDTPNFVGNRIGVQGMLKAINLMLEEGLNIEQVDALFGPVLGRPKTALFALCDLVGIDTLGHIAQNTYNLIPHDEERESFTLPKFVYDMIGQKRLGKKTKNGFYKTEYTSDGKKHLKVINPKTLEYEDSLKPDFPCLEQAKKAKTLPEKMKAILYGNDNGARFAWKLTANGFIYAANRIPEIAGSILEIDNAMKWGFNFEMGPFEQWDAIGLEASVKKMEADGLPVPEKIKQMLADGKTVFYKFHDGRSWFYDFSAADYRPVPESPYAVSLKRLKESSRIVESLPSASLIDLGDGVYCLEFHTKMNAINDQIISLLDKSIDYVDQNGVGLVIGNQAGGMPGAFSAGADLMLMAGLAMERKFRIIEQVVKQFQYVLVKARYSPFPVVAAPFGLTLGGGCEVCLSADRIIAHSDLYMGLVEIGVGLLPAGGGCLNLWRKMIESIPDSVSGLDLARFFLPVFTAIATAKVSTSAADARQIGFLGPLDRILFNRDHLIMEAKKEVLRMAEAGYAPPVKKKVKVMGETAQGMANAEIFNLQSGNFITEYDAYLAKKIAYVISGGDVRDGSEIDEDILLTLERETFVDLWLKPKTHARVEHMLKTGKPLRN
ncbi:MAG: 3-hydroxyacyl-CoA dehydrogenase NAD-binding domain-containing protein [Thermodesulfobacteriota bacterium]